MFYNAEQLNELAAGFAAVAAKVDKLTTGFLTRDYVSPRAAEFARHGLARRLYTIQHCIERVFDELPPDLDEVPARRTVVEATVQIQAFIFNLFGAIDNLAWIWVVEQNVVKPVGGDPLPASRVGLGPGPIHTTVRDSLPVHLRDYLVTLGAWFEHLENFRHALAHRIPLYIPPYFVTEGNAAAYNELGSASWEAFRRRDFEEQERLDAEQLKLAAFRPIITHSIADNAPLAYFHFQMLSDFGALDEIAGRMLAALNEPPA